MKTTIKWRALTTLSHWSTSSFSRGSMYIIISAATDIDR